MSPNFSSAPASATTTNPAISTPSGAANLNISTIGAIVGGVLGGILFFALVGGGILFFFCSTGRRPGRSQKVKLKTPNWAKRVWNAEGSYGAAHGNKHASQRAVKRSKSAETESQTEITMADLDLEHGTTAVPKKKKKSKRAYGVLPWGQHDAAEELREQQERQAQQEQQQQQQQQQYQRQQQQQQFGAQTNPQLAQGHGCGMPGGESQPYGYAYAPQQQQQPPHWQSQHPQAVVGHQLAQQQAAFQQQVAMQQQVALQQQLASQQLANAGAVYYPPPPQ